jgi:Family of unknown function (DUF6272)
MIYESIKNNICEDEMLLVSGKMNSNIMRDSISIIEQKLNYKNFQVGRITKAKFICTELIQNVFKHGALSLENPAYFKLSIHDNNDLVITTGNSIIKEKAVSLRQNLNRIQHLNSIQLKEEFIEGMKYNAVSKDDNAGLGILSVCHRANQQLHFSIEEINNTDNYLTIKVTI